MREQTRPIILLLVVAMLLLSTSCIQRKKMLYTGGTTELSSLQLSASTPEAKTIRSHERLYIRIMSLDEQTSRLFNADSRSYGEIDLHLNSYTVNDSGYIDIPFVGQLKVEGFTLSQARKRVEEQLALYLPNTSVDLKYAGNYVTILGEVRLPGNHLFFKERLSIFEAIGHAGGILDYGNKQEITLVRTEAGQTTYHTVDISRADIAQSEFFYIQPDDVLIVQPLNAKFRTLRNFSFESLVLSGVTTIITVLYFFSAN